MALRRAERVIEVKIGVVFPGQGSQVVGMGTDVAAHNEDARRCFARAGSVLGYDLLALVSEGPEAVLRETIHSQPAIFTTNVALYAAVGDALAPVVTAGHSFAEFCSLVAAGSLKFEEAVEIVDRRAKAMQSAAERAPGGMTAVLGLEAQRVREIVDATRQRTGAAVQLANLNAPTQIVISGDLGAVEAAGEAMLAAGAKRVVALNVSGAWHSELMNTAVDSFRVAVERNAFRLPEFDVVSNVDAQPYRDVETIKRNLVRSIVQEVRWHDTAQRVLSYGLDLVVEFGASSVLGPLIRRMETPVRTMTVSDYAGVEKLRATIRDQTANARKMQV
jgi:[acyl-carrier-protein] S-malonyltransferase